MEILLLHTRGVRGPAKIMYPNVANVDSMPGLVACLGHDDKPQFILVRFNAHDAASVPTGDR